MKALEVLAVASEVFPLIKTGGLADVVGAMPDALSHESIRVRTLVPGYPAVMAALRDFEHLADLPNLPGGAARILSGRAAGLDLLVVDAPKLFERAGNPYLAADGVDWSDNAGRFAALSLTAAEIAMGLLPDYAPALVHAHDWQGALTFAYLHFRAPRSRCPATVLTIHNLAFQGHFPAEIFPTLGLPTEAFGIDGIEYHGGVSFLKAGLQYADRITTVSPTYAAEIRLPDLGMGLDGMIRARGRAVSGILNGIDTTEWDPVIDPRIASPFAPGDWEARRKNKAALQARMGLDGDADRLLFGWVGRLTWQKGVDLLLATLPTLLGLDAQLVVLGSGDRSFEQAIVAAAGANAGRIACFIGYDEALAHGVQAGADVLLVPSRFEPCGLTQLHALRYGAVPLVARVGGLADTVIDANPAALAKGVATGLQFVPPSEEMMRVALERAAALYRRPDAWRLLQENGMASDVSWRESAKAYAALFRSLLAEQP